MKQKTRNTIRKWTGLILSICIFGLMMPIGVFAEQTNGTAFTYTGGVEDSTYTGDNALGDLVLPDPIELEDGKTEYAALVVDFPDQEGGGDVTMKTGNLTSNANPVNKTVGYDDPEYPYPVEYGWGETEITYEPHALTVKMDDSSTLDLDTGNITNTAGDAAKIVVTDLSKLELKTGAVEATEDGAEIQTSEGADIKIDFGTINVDGNGINLQSNDSNREKAPCKTEIQTESITSGGTGIQAESNNSDAKITVDGDINSGSAGLSLKIQYGGTAEVTVNGDIQNSGYSGVGISAENDVTVNVKTGNISGEGGVNLRNAAGTGDRSEVTIETGAIDVKNNGLDISTYTSTTNVTVNG